MRRLHGGHDGRRRSQGTQSRNRAHARVLGWEGAFSAWARSGGEVTGSCTPPKGAAVPCQPCGVGRLSSERPAHRIPCSLFALLQHCHRQIQRSCVTNGPSVALAQNSHHALLGARRFWAAVLSICPSPYPILFLSTLWFGSVEHRSWSSTLINDFCIRISSDPSDNRSAGVVTDNLQLRTAKHKKVKMTVAT